MAKDQPCALLAAMPIFRFAVLSLLVSASAWAIAASQPAGAELPASVTMTILPDLTPLKIPPRAEAVLAHLTRRLTPDMVRNFDLFLYVSKSASGPLAQRMYVFEKNKPDGLALAYEWAASTGREKAEVNARGRHVLTATPIGYYQLDPRRMYPRYRSASWDQDMPNTMFLDWERAGAQTGLAIHAAAPPDIAKLGSRASGGCVHLSPDHAATLFELIRANYRGPVPRFAYDDETHTRSNRG
ncbi:MAG TPA: L,D-transpeptidase, partial [Rhizomicrobium sp.]|nr:L,D-transpeptidase [Rhizomicrobium sp.]